MESNYLAISIGHQSMFLKNVLFKPFLGKGWWEFKHPLLRSGSSSNYWGLTHIQTFFEVRRRKNSEEQENKFLNPDQWSGKGPPESWLAILGCKHAPDFEKIRSSIPELWQGQCIIYAELKPQEAFPPTNHVAHCGSRLVESVWEKIRPSRLNRPSSIYLVVLTPIEVPCFK